MMRQVHKRWNCNTSQNKVIKDTEQEITNKIASFTLINWSNHHSRRVG